MGNSEIQEHILEKWLAGDLTARELEEFMQHKDFKLYEAILKESKNLKIDSFNKEDAFEKLWNKISNQKDEKIISIQQAQTPKKKTKWILPLGAAASIAALLLVAVMTMKNDHNEILEATVPNTTIHKVAKNNCEKLTLPDGSIVEMDKGAEVSYDSVLFAEQRQIHVSGDVFLNIKKGSSFDVLTEQARVGVLGTSFSVYNSNDEFQSFCSTGLVKVALPDNSQSVVLKPGMGVELTADGLKELVFKTPPVKKKGISFSNKSLFEVFTELANYNHVKFKFSGDAGMRTYSGVLNPHDLDGCLASIQRATKIKWKRNGNVIEIQ